MAFKTRADLISAYIKFFKEKNHKEIPSAPLIPENDPTVLFTTAGMHPLVPYLLGQKHPQGTRIVSVQKCIRTSDIDEVGDEFHLSFFEMLGNWSFGDYWKKEAIDYSLEFLTKILRIPKEKINITCFAGDRDAPKDEETAKIWQDLGIKKEHIKFLEKKDNWWGPAGATGPCGPDTEMFVNGFEIWNDVFMQYNKTEKGDYAELKQKNVDTGMGVERTVAILNNLNDIYLTETFLPLIKEIEKISKKKYEDSKRQIRIIADHLKASVFILAEKITPSNKEHGYVLRRLIRRAIRFGKNIMIQNNFTRNLAGIIIAIYPDYPDLKENEKFILEEIEREESRFRQTLASGLRFFKKISKGKTEISGKDAFLLYQSYGFPIEMTDELAKERKMRINMKDYLSELENHQKLSRTASAEKFKAGLADNSQETTKLHTASHLLLYALRKVLNKDIMQKGSNITPERLRFDFNFERKLDEEEIKKIENVVNGKIKQNIQVVRKEMPAGEAKKIAKSEFEYKAATLSVYIIDDCTEICAGPHVSNTKELGKFKIIREEGVAAGIRRIKAVLE